MEQQLASNAENREVRMFRLPTLETVKMVEITIDKYSGEFKKTQLWEKLSRKVMWPTYLVILDYLEEMNRIIISDNGIITYIWNPELAKKYLAKKHLYYGKGKQKHKN
ncbi:MAG: hypothetical protein K8R02_01470 [Anaerohalosphaeraceae bacterium]|nr:hypothetical protein [Anaerohalosphaeraceae bacterium]